MCLQMDKPGPTAHKHHVGMGTNQRKLRRVHGVVPIYARVVCAEQRKEAGSSNNNEQRVKITILCKAWNGVVEESAGTSLAVLTLVDVLLYYIMLGVLKTSCTPTTGPLACNLSSHLPPPIHPSESCDVRSATSKKEGGVTAREKHHASASAPCCVLCRAPLRSYFFRCVAFAYVWLAEHVQWKYTTNG